MTEQLKPCPFCGNTEPGFERIGTSRQSCIVACGDCGARHESSDEGEASGASWNRRAQPAQAVPVLTDAEIHAADPIPQNRFDQERVEFARRVEQAVRAKMGAVPMTDPQLQTSEERRATGERIMALATSELSDLVRRARAIVVGHQRGSISLVQRHLRISYNTAAKLLEALEQEGVVSPQRQNGQREVLVLPNISGIVGKEGA